MTLRYTFDPEWPQSLVCLLQGTGRWHNLEEVGRVEIRSLAVCLYLNGTYLSLSAPALSDEWCHHRPKATGPSYHGLNRLTFAFLRYFDTVIEN